MGFYVSNDPTNSVKALKEVVVLKIRLQSHQVHLTVLQYYTCMQCTVRHKIHTYTTRKPRKGAAVIAASMHGFASCRKFKSPVTLTLDRVKVKSTYKVHVGLPAGPTT